MDDGDITEPPTFSCEKCGAIMKPKKYEGVHGITYEFYTEIVIMSEVGSEKLDSEEVFEEIVSLLHCYSMKLYSKRKGQKIKKVLEESEEIIMFTLKSGEGISLSEAELIVSNFLFKVIEENISYMWVAEEEPFINQYSGKISYDHSGKIEKITSSDLKELVKNLGNNPVSICYDSELEELLSEIYINQWMPSYQSNCGKHWISYKDLFEERFNKWKYENFELYDEDGDDFNEELDIELDEILYEFLRKIAIDIYYGKILKGLE